MQYARRSSDTDVIVQPLRKWRLVDAELGDGGNAARLRDDQSDAARGHGADPMELVLAYRCSGRDRRPRAVRLRFDVVLRDPLTERDRFLDADDVEGAWGT